jgi:hypothetical protein
MTMSAMETKPYPEPITGSGYWGVWNNVDNHWLTKNNHIVVFPHRAIAQAQSNTSGKPWIAKEFE